MRHSKMSQLVPLVMVASACGGEPVDIGDDRVVRTGETMSDYAAEWVGYGEAHTFWEDSGVIRIALDQNGEGTLEVGAAPAIPPATNPDVGYPEGESDRPGAGATGPSVVLRSGFTYTVQGATVEDRRLRLGVNLHELYEGWCAMQTPYLAEESSTYHCLPISSGGFDGSQCFLDDPETGEPIYADCAKIGMCTIGGVCSCTADGCVASSEINVRLDAALESAGDELEGTLVVHGTNVTVRMTRQ